MCSTDTFSKLATKGIHTTVISPSGDRYPLQIMPFDSLSSVEGWFNSVARGCDVQRLRVVMNQNPELASLIIIDKEKQITHSQLSNLYRGFSGDSYPKMHMQIADRLYSSGDSIFTALCDCADGPQNVFDMGLLIQLLDGDIEQTPPVMRFGAVQKSLKVFELLLRLHFYTKEPAYNSSFCRRIMTMLAEPLASVGRFSSAMTTILKYPFLFDFKMRFIWLKLATFDPLSSIRIFSRIFGASLQPKIPEQEIVHVCVHRDSIFTDGVLIFQHFAQNRMGLEVSFAGEDDPCPNPVHEFFSLLAKEFQRPKRYFFRSSDIQSDFCVSKKGLFFCPKSDPRCYTILGVFLAKCILLECNIDLDINPAFFSYVRFNTVTVEDVDPDLADYLQHKEELIGNMFVYPGYPSLELCEGGNKMEVNEDNIDEYIRLVEDFTCGDHLRDQSDAFRKGFSKIIPWNSLEIFTEEEISYIIKGEEPSFTAKELRESLRPGVGFSTDSPQFRMFYEILLEMSLEERKKLIFFLTGTTRLPPGGITELSPKITVSMRFAEDGENPDENMPNGSARANVIKIPEYSSKEIMREKLLAAANEVYQ
jgi:E3 ubiquitin-protein ligase TRIP12